MKKPERCIYQHSDHLIVVEVTGLEVSLEEVSSHSIIKITVNKEVVELSAFPCNKALQHRNILATEI